MPTEPRAVRENDGGNVNYTVISSDTVPFHVR